MTANKKRPTVGDECWEVEWVSKMVFDDGGDVLPDACERSYRRFPTRAAAVEFARKVWPTTTDKGGIVEITPMVFSAYDDRDAAKFPQVGFWEAADDSEIIEDDTGEPHK